LAERALSFARWAEASALGVWMRESANAYPAANILHLLGLVLLLGAIGIVDLRIAGALRALPLQATVRTLTPLGLAGLVLLALTGPLLFAADATALVRSDVFARKLVLIGFALLNALVFRWQWRRGGEPTALMRAGAILFLLLWIMVAALGRLIAYR
jgi:hypothetical protein